MARARVNPAWIKGIEEQVETGRFEGIILSYNAATQWLITYLAHKGIPVVVTNLGAGVKRITVAEKVCTKCKGTGKET